MTSGKSNSLILILALIGLATGGLLGFLFRPSAFIIGQLPFDMVITRGIYLQGVDRMLIPLAESSFNQMTTIAAIGALIGAALGFVMTKR